MAVITEETEESEINPLINPSNQHKSPPKPTKSTNLSNSSPPTSPPPPPPTTTNPFIFWALLTLFVSAITLFFVLISSLSPQDDKSWFLSLPTSLRHHYSKGRTVKIQTGPFGSGSGSTIDVFAIEEGPRKAETVLLLHGLGSSSYSFRNVVRLLGLNGVRAVAIDLPGCGFSDKYIVEEEEEIDGLGGVFGRIWGVYREIQQKGLFWGFDQLVESGRVPYEEIEIRVSTRRKNWRHLKLGAEEMGRLIGQVTEGLNLSPVHLVLHDSALGMSANWVAENSKLVSSLTVIDSLPNSVSLPLWALEVFGVREVLLGFNLVYGGLLRWCCVKSMEGSEVEANRVLLKGRDGRRAVVGIGRSLNYSFSVEEWAGLEVMKGVPVQVVWSGNWSEEWSKEGERVASAFPQARFVSHSGSRWPQSPVRIESVAEDDGKHSHPGGNNYECRPFQQRDFIPLPLLDTISVREQGFFCLALGP